MEDATDRGLTIAVTGVSGYLGRRLVDLLSASTEVDRVLGFDIREPRARQEKLVFDLVDVRNPHIAARLEGVDALVHLAFVMNPTRDEQEMREINVMGSQNVLRAAATAGVKRVVYTSSATVYGAHPDNDVPLTEESPLRANLDFSYPAHKLEVEYVIKEFRTDFPETVVTVFRPAVVLGAHADSVWSHLLELPFLIGVNDAAPPFQFVHEDDVAEALAFAVLNELDGSYNLAPRGWLDHATVMALVGKRRLELPEPAAYAVLDRLWKFGLGEVPAGLLHYIMHPWVVSPEKLASAGFECSHSSAEALAAALELTRPYVRIGRRRLQKQNLAAVGAAVGSLALAGAIGGRLRRRR